MHVLGGIAVSGLPHMTFAEKGHEQYINCADRKGGVGQKGGRVKFTGFVNVTHVAPLNLAADKGNCTCFSLLSLSRSLSASMTRI